MRALLPMLVLLGCTDRERPSPEPAPAPAPVAVRPAVEPAPAPPPLDAPSTDAPSIDAAVANPKPPANLVVYLDVLLLDLEMFSLVINFPGLPTGTRFEVDDYAWQAPSRNDLPSVLARARETTDASTTPVDDAVRAYLDVAEKVAPPVIALNAYYASQRFIDDEFDRARRERGAVDQARRSLAKVRGELWRSVLAAWREASDDVPDSPRAIVTLAWSSCLHVVESLVTTGLGRSHDRAISACRRSIPTLTVLPRDSYKDYDEVLREVIGKLGDHAVANYAWRVKYLTPEIHAMVGKYLALWPDLPNTPAERPQ